MEKPTADEILEWQQNRVTKWFGSKLEEEIDRLGNMLRSGNTMASDPGATAQLTARMIGEISGIEASLDFMKEYHD
jgi:hypothetical protein